ncbi:MAG TPA: type I phosphomannose isomerase catalytic subunit [Mucilaginibacter sp.]|jgi:mannose-6-phosphate isomerase|nr:type I phosphomannose isomerase catalytic subunit [Mucilaginibacter sp.]
MSLSKLYPLKFEPIYQYRIWGGRRLADLLTKPLPPDDLIGEAWILSDRDDHPSKVTDGPLKGQTICQLFEHSYEGLMGKMSGHFKRFPLLLKFLDCRKVLSVQVHPTDDQKKYIPAGESGKTEAWVVLQTGKEAIIYAGLKPGTNEEKLRNSLEKHTVADDLASFKPAVGDSVLIKAGTVHTLGDVVVFEVQENSDVTYRLYDWDRVDEKTGKPRDLQVEQALACIDFTKTAIKPVTPVIQVAERILCEKLIEDPHFTVWRYTGTTSFTVGKKKTPRILVGIEGDGEVEFNGDKYKLTKGDVMLLPAIVGACPLVPAGRIILLEIAIPEK